MSENNEKRVYVAVAGTVQSPTKSIVQPPGRQIAQACHVVTLLRHNNMYLRVRVDGKAISNFFRPITTIILQARDSNELKHVSDLLYEKKRLYPVFFFDENPEYGEQELCTAIAVLATKDQITGILDYLPLWKG